MEGRESLGKVVEVPTVLTEPQHGSLTPDNALWLFENVFGLPESKEMVLNEIALHTKENTAAKHDKMTTKH